MSAIKRHIEELAEKLGKSFNEITEEDIKLSMQPMVFELSAEQTIEYKEWRKTKPANKAAIGGAFTFCFTPTSIGVMVEVQHADGSKLDLTENL